MRLFSGCALLGSNGQERHVDCRINGAGVVEEAADNLLDAFFAGFVEFGTGVAGYCVLIVFAILDGIWAVGAMLGLFRRMLALICRHIICLSASQVRCHNIGCQSNLQQCCRFLCEGQQTGV